MSKNSGGYMGTQVGKLGPAVGSMWKGRNIFRAYNPFVKNPRTEKQQLQRARFSVIAKLATSMSNVVNFGFASKAGQERNLPRALFIRENMPCVHANTVDSVTIDYADLVVSRGGLDTPRFGTPQFDTPQQVAVSFSTAVVGVATLLTCASVSQWCATKLRKNSGSASCIRMRFLHSYVFFLFVFVMPVGGKYDDSHLSVIYLIHEAVFLRNMTAPLIGAVAAQLLGMACACTRMLPQLSFQFQQFLESVGFVLLASRTACF